MATRRQAEAHRQAVEDLVALAMRDLLAFWRALDLADAAVATATIREIVGEVGTAYSLAASALAADFYDELRAAANAPGNYRAELADPPDRERLDALAGWAAGPLWAATPDADAALTKLAGGLQRVVAGGGRGTIARNVAQDPGDARWARHASAGACAFCAMTATRGAVYHSENTAGGHYHDACHCVAVPVWDSGPPYEEPPYVEQWREAYTDATTEVGGAKTKPVLAEMRRTLGAK